MIDLQILLDQQASLEARADAVDRLRYEAGERYNDPPDWFDDPSVIDALSEFASETYEEFPICLDAAEALAQVWMSKGWVDNDRFRSLAASARREVLAYLRLNRPELLAGLDE